MSLFRRELCKARLAAASSREAIVALARALTDAGFAHPTLEDAVLAREAQSPTGLPLAGRKAAIPHADPEHVREPAVAVATLATPVRFREMGNPEVELAVELVVLLALPNLESAQQELVRLVERLQEPSFVDRLCAAEDDAALHALLAEEPSR